MRINRRNANGSINMFWAEGNHDNGVNVSPYMDNFREQVEDLIWPAVFELLKRNYLTVTSCQGHSLNDSAFVTVSFSNKATADKFIKLISSSVVYAEYDDTITSSVDKLNELFLRSYPEYFHVRTGVLQYHPLVNFFLIPAKKLFIKLFVKKIKTLPNYESIN